MMSQHAHSEIVGMLPEGNWITRAPNLRRKMALLAKVQDEAGHGLYIYCGTETLGVDRARADPAAAQRHGEVLEHLQLSRRSRWADIGCIGWFVDGAAIVNQTMLAQGVVRPVRARDGAHLQGRELPQAPGLRDHGDARRRHAGADARWRRTP